MRELTLEQIKVLNDRLRAFDGSWVKVKEAFGNKPSTNYLDHLTITQILNYATYGITTWDYVIEEQWREEVHKKDKNSNQWIFDGYVYHVKATLHIAGLGSRTQFGKKVATGGATGQDMSYQSAASNALSKCASLFGVGEALYVSQHQIISQAFAYEETVRLLGHIQQTPTLQTAILQTAQPIQPMPNAMEQVNQEVEQLFSGVQPQQQPSWINTESNAFVENQMPTGFGGQAQQQAQASWEQSSQTWQPQQNAPQPGPDDVKFMQENNVPFGNAQTQPQMSQEPAPQQVHMPQPTQVMGAPINVGQEPKQVEQEPMQVQGSDMQKQFMEQITLYNQHKTRLGYKEDSQMAPYLRDYFKDENASTANLNMQTIVGFNEYMLTIQV